MVERSDTNGQAAHDDGGDRDAFATFLDCAASAGAGAARIGNHVSTLLAVRADRARLAFRSAIARACVAVLALLGLGAAIVTASWKIVAGACDVAATLLPDRPGLGDLAGGTSVLVASSAASWILWKSYQRAHFKRRAAEYARRRSEQARRFDDVADPRTPPDGERSARSRGA